MKTWVYRLLTCVVMTAVGLGFVVCAASREVVLTVGFVSDSYWDAPLGNCYAVLDSGKMGNTQYALPYECVPTLMFVNKTLLEKNGISVPSNDWTWDDFYRICKQITRDTDGDGSIDQFGSYGYTWQNALTSNGAALFSDDGKQCLIAQPEAVEAIAFSQKLEKLYETCDITAQDFDTGHVAFRPFLFSDYRTYQWTAVPCTSSWHGSS